MAKLPTRRDDTLPANSQTEARLSSGAAPGSVAQQPRTGASRPEELAASATGSAAMLLGHNAVFGAVVLKSQVRPLLPEEWDATEYLADTLKTMQPRDPLEQMLIMQAIWAHARVARLSAVANQQQGMQQIRIVNDAADRAANTFRKLMQALADYRRPPKAESVTIVKQANLANQQVVNNAQNQILARPNSSNELGSPSPSLLPDGSGIGIPAASGDVSQALDAEHRPADGSRQEPEPDERDQARGA